MSEFASPDVPAYICYLIVLLVGTFVAASSVNRLLADYPGHWGFARTWTMFASYVLLPVVLFWFLDYTSALQDTSLFAALAVAAGYQQIFAGGVQGIVMPGQTPRLWKPFEAWVKQLAASIASRHKRQLDRFDEWVRTYLARTPERLKALHALAFEQSTNAADLEASLAALAGEAAPPEVPPSAFADIQNRKRVRILLRDLRASLPEDYGYYLYQRKLIPWLTYWLWREQGMSKMVVLLVFMLLAVGSIQAVVLFRSDSTQIWYHHWRFTKSKASERDHFRSREYLGRKLRSIATEGNPASEQGEAVMAPLLRTLRFKEVSPRLADDVLRLVVDFHAPAVNAVVVPQLIDALRTENADVRLRIHRTLLSLREADYSGSALNTALAKWVPTKDESAGDIDSRARSWQAWWLPAQKRPPASSRPAR